MVQQTLLGLQGCIAWPPQGMDRSRSSRLGSAPGGRRRMGRPGRVKPASDPRRRHRNTSSRLVKAKRTSVRAASGRSRKTVTGMPTTPARSGYATELPRHPRSQRCGVGDHEVVPRAAPRRRDRPPAGRRPADPGLACSVRPRDRHTRHLAQGRWRRSVGRGRSRHRSRTRLTARPRHRVAGPLTQPTFHPVVEASPADRPSIRRLASGRHRNKASAEDQMS